MEEGYAAIRKAVLDVLGAHGIDAREVRLMPIEPPRAWGVSTNACMQLGPQVAKPEIDLLTEGVGKKEAKKIAAQVSREVSEKLAEHLAEELQGHSLPFVASVEAEGAYVNFYYDAPALAAQVVEHALGKAYGALDADARTALLTDPDAYGHGKPTGKRIMVEYAQPNTHKDFHVGHLRNASIGQAIANLLEYAGNDVLRATYIGDMGLHIAGVEYGMKHRIVRCAQWIMNEKVALLVACRITRTSRVIKQPENLPNHIRELRTGLNTLMAFLHDEGDFPTPTSYASYVVQESDAISEEIVFDEELVQKLRAIASQSFLSHCGVIYNSMTLVLGSASELETAIGEYLSANRAEDPEVGKELALTRVALKALEAVLMIEQYKWVDDWENGIGREGWQVSRDKCVSEFRQIFAELILDVDVAFWFYESTVDDTKLGKKTAAELKELGIAIIDESEKYKGALYVDFAEQVDAVRDGGQGRPPHPEPVFRDDEKKRIRKLGKLTIQRSDGTSLYQTKELGLAKHKFDLVRERFGSDLDESLYVVGAEQKLYFQQVFAILKLWGFPNAENCKHISYELVVLPGGKMSSREGNIVSYRELRDEAIKRAREITAEKGIAGDVEKTAHDIAIAAIKYAMLMVTGSQQIVFDFEQALSFSGRAAPYLQYAYARAGKLVVGDLIAGGAGVSPADSTNGGQDARPTHQDSQLSHGNPGYELHDSELMLARVLGAFPAVCVDAAAHYEPATLCTYLYDLATAFSDFYRDCRVLDADEPMCTFRIRLCAGFRQVMRTGFAILALPLPEEM